MRFDDCRDLFEISLIINCGENIRGASKETTEVVQLSNYEAAGTRFTQG